MYSSGHQSEAQTGTAHDRKSVKTREGKADEIWFIKCDDKMRGEDGAQEGKSIVCVCCC